METTPNSFQGGLLLRLSVRTPTQAYKSNPPFHRPTILFLKLNCLQEAFQVDQIVPKLLSIMDIGCVMTALIYMAAGPLLGSVSGTVRRRA
jgi:hypothetical protein